MFFGQEQIEEMQRAAAVVPSDMTHTDFLVKLKQHVKVVDRRFTALLEKAAKDTRTNRTNAQERMAYAEMLIMRELDGIMAEALEAAELPGEVWQGCLVKFGSHPDVIAELMASHQRQEVLKMQLLSS